MSNLSSLEQSLLSAKKFMDHDKMSVVESPTQQQYSREQEPPMELLSSLPPGQAPASAAPRQENMQPHSALTPERINSSGLPSAIKEAMISHPIPDINAGPNLNDDFLSKVAGKMNDDRYSVNSMRSTANNSVDTIPQVMQEQRTVTPIQNNAIPSPTNLPSSIDVMSLKDEIKLMISESLDELVESKVNKLLTESKNVKENLQFRIGGKIFTGKISKVKSIVS
jgi:hypothetical protein